jgi:hypothetical protein
MQSNIVTKNNELFVATMVVENGEVIILGMLIFGQPNNTCHMTKSPLWHIIINGRKHN